MIGVGFSYYIIIVYTISPLPLTYFKRMIKSTQYVYRNRVPPRSTKAALFIKRRMGALAFAQKRIFLETELVNDNSPPSRRVFIL